MSSEPDYRIRFASVSGMDDSSLVWAVIAKVWPHVADPNEWARMRHATPGQRAILATTLFIRELDNGGFEQFFWNGSGDIVNEVVTGFRQLGLNDDAQIVQEAATFFGSKPGTATQAERRDLLAKASTAVTNAFFEPLNKKLYGESRLWPLFRRYIDLHPEEFFSDVRESS